jgi:hypothetical protein
MIRNPKMLGMKPNSESSAFWMLLAICTAAIDINTSG